MIFKIRPKYTYYIKLLSTVSEPRKNKLDSNIIQNYIPKIVRNRLMFGNLVRKYYAVKPCLVQYSISSGISDPLRLTYWT